MLGVKRRDALGLFLLLLETFIPWTLVKRRVRREIITPLGAPSEFRQEAAMERSGLLAAQDTPLIRALGLAHHWQRLLDNGTFNSMAEIAAVEGIDPAQLSRIARLVGLAPDRIESILPSTGLLPSLERLTRTKLSMNWNEQLSW